MMKPTRPLTPLLARAPRGVLPSKTEIFSLRIHGLCGSGKTTLARRLAPVLDAKIFEIGRYRRRFRAEPESWELMASDIQYHLEHGGRAIVPTTGLNRNEPLLDTFPDAPLVWIDADLPTLDRRVRSKPFWERGYFNWFSQPVYRHLGNKFEFNRRALEFYRVLHTEGMRLDANQTPEKLAQGLCRYLQSLGYYWPQIDRTDSEGVLYYER